MPAPVDLRPPPDSADEIRRRADEILSRPEFRPDPKSLYERALDFLAEQLDRVISLLVGGGRGALLAWLVVVALVGALVYAAVRFARGVQHRAHIGGDGSVERQRPASEWRTEAAEHEQLREWRAALRCRYRALVADLADRGLVDEIPGRTAGEYRREVAAAAPRVSGEFARVTDLFESAWYGDLPTGEAENVEVRSLADRVLAATHA